VKNVSCQCLELGVHSEVHRGLPSNTLKGVSVFQGDGGGACVVSLKYFLMDGMELVDAAASLAVFKTYFALSNLQQYYLIGGRLRYI